MKIGEYNMSFQGYRQKIEKIWQNKENLSSTSLDEKKTIDHILLALDSGEIRVAEKANNIWHVNEWIKKAILLSFRIYPNQKISGGPGGFNLDPAIWFDKLPNKFSGWDEKKFTESKIRAVPNCIARYPSFIDKNVVLMPSFVNLGAYIGAGTMVDTWATVGSCAQIGKNCHISGGAGIGGVLEPLNARPTIIEDNCFIGARSEIAEGVIIGEGAVISMGVFIGASTKIVDRETGEIHYGRVPAGSVVVAGSLPSKCGTYSLYAAIIVKKVVKLCC